MIETILILAGVIFAFFFLFDLFYQKKKEGYFIIRFVALVVVSAPAFIDGLEFWKDKKEYFYISMLLTIVSGFLIILFLLHRYITKKSSEHYGLSILSAIYDGFELFRKQLKEDIKKKQKEKIEYDKTLLAIHKDLNQELPKFISSIYKSIDEYDDFKIYATSVMEGFVSTFFSSNDARFTLRQIDDENKNMVAMITTKDNTPKEIPVSSVNMVTASMKDRKPKIYSINPEKHYETNGSIANGIYEDYVTYCLLSEDEKVPLVSINLDVKGMQAKNRMKVLVDTSIFEIVSNALVVFLEKKGAI